MQNSIFEMQTIEDTVELASNGNDGHSGGSGYAHGNGILIQQTATVANEAEGILGVLSVVDTLIETKTLDELLSQEYFDKFSIAIQNELLRRVR